MEQHQHVVLQQGIGTLAVEAGADRPTANGFAGPKATSAKKAHTANITTSAQATSASSRRLRNRHATAAVKPASTTTHSRIEPSRALHIAATL